MQEGLERRIGYSATNKRYAMARMLYRFLQALILPVEVFALRGAKGIGGHWIYLLEGAAGWNIGTGTSSKMTRGPLKSRSFVYDTTIAIGHCLVPPSRPELRTSNHGF